MSELKAKPKAPRGRKKKCLDPDKAFEWFDELAFDQAKKKHQEWEEAYLTCKAVTCTDSENLEDYESNLRGKYPESIIKLTSNLWH